MASKNMIQQLGAEYVTQFFNGSFFRVGDAVHLIRRVQSSSVEVDTLNLEEKNGRFSRGSVPWSAIPDFKSLEFPKMGYRQFKSGGQLMVMNISTHRSTQRGFRLEHLSVAPLPIYNVISTRAHVVWDSLQVPARIRLLYKPQYTPFSKGLVRLLEGKIPAFAVSSDIAVSISSDTQETPYQVYLKGKSVGHIDNDGSLYLSSKTLSRPEFSKHFK